jgi:hypothetical protein
MFTTKTVLAAAAAAVMAAALAGPASAGCFGEPAAGQECPYCGTKHLTRRQAFLDGLPIREANIIEIYGRHLSLEKIEEIRRDVYWDTVPQDVLVIGSGVRLPGMPFNFRSRSSFDGRMFTNTRWQVRYQDALLKALESQQAFECAFQDIDLFNAGGGADGGAL